MFIFFILFLLKSYIEISTISAGIIMNSSSARHAFEPQNHSELIKKHCQSLVEDGFAFWVVNVNDQKELHFITGEIFQFNALGVIRLK